MALLFAFCVQSSAQYKRRGETLQTRGNKTAKPKKPDYTIAQFKGKWQEFERRNRADSSIVTFNDSIQLYFIDTQSNFSLKNIGAFRDNQIVSF